MRSLVLTTLFVVLPLFSCTNFVQNVDAPIDSVNDDQLNAESEVRFLINGCKVQYMTCLGELGVLSGGLSDELLFSLDIRGATYPQYEEIENGIISINNNSVQNALDHVGYLRITADTLLARVDRIQFKDSTLRSQTRWASYFYGGIARYLFASYFALEPTRGGMAIGGGPFIPSDSMYQLAVDCFKKAMAASSNTEYRLAASYLARTLLMAGRYAEAEEAIGNAMLLQEPAFVLKYSNELDNFWYNNAGGGRMQWAMDNRFKKYVDAEILDTTRIKFQSVQGTSGSKYYLMQWLYPSASAPITAMTWQECFLMQAEVLLRLHPQKIQDAMDAFNFVRDSHGLPNIDAITLDSIYVERDKELNCTGNRLLDERRFKKWHLPAGTWQYLPITVNERSRNPNLK